MVSLFEAARFLQIPAKDRPLTSQLQYLRYLDKGLPASSVDRIAGTLAPGDAKFRYRIVPRATLARMKNRLSKSQGEKVTWLAALWTDALRVWKTEDEARDFLHRRHPLLDNRRPIDLALEGAIGAGLVRDVLGRLEHGTAV